LKPPPFAYHAPATVDDALRLLAQHGEAAKPLAGGQSLVPLLNFRLARPEHLIDLNGLGELAGIRRVAGALRIGAMTRHADLEASRLVRDHWPLLTEALSFVAHAQIRNRGTVGGSIAHADAAAELPVAFLALDAVVRTRSARGAREIRVEDLFVTHLTTTLEPDELLVEIEVPTQPPRTGHAFVEFARRHGDFALGGAAAVVTIGADGACERAAVALLGAGATPLLAREAGEALSGRRVDEAAAAEAAAAAVAGITPTGDIHGSAEYRRELIEVMARRAIEAAAARAHGERQ
jgi:carbon-monoxide dehydrogenase medium subunit/6-hydroxypseudooxynicotine dehydrogenase subunit alpha